MVQIEENVKLDFNNVLIKPRRSNLQSRSDVSIQNTYTFLHSSETWSGVPIMVSNMDTTGTFEMANALSEYKIITCLHKHYLPVNWDNFLENKDIDFYNYICISTGTSQNDYDKTVEIISKHPNIKMIMIDVANGYSQHFVNCLEKFRKKFPTKIIIAGNVVTPEMTETLLLQGADVVKIGIGPGSVCTTRKKTGVGYPQLSCILECTEVAHRLGGLVVSDGGCTCPGDFSKAYGAGADFVMSGGIFSAHNESAGDLIEKNGKKYKTFYGMSSKTAMEKHTGSVANYRTSEGKDVLIELKGPVKNTVLDILGGIRSTCTYVGAKSLGDLSKHTTFIRVSNQLNNIYK
jgi:GMP reductase